MKELKSTRRTNLISFKLGSQNSYRALLLATSLPIQLVRLPPSPNGQGGGAIKIWHRWRDRHIYAPKIDNYIPNGEGSNTTFSLTDFKVFFVNLGYFKQEVTSTFP